MTGSSPVTVLLAVEESEVAPGLTGFLVVLGLAVALFFLMRSLAKHLRRIDVDRDRDDLPPEDPGNEPPLPPR